MPTHESDAAPSSAGESPEEAASADAVGPRGLDLRSWRFWALVALEVSVVAACLSVVFFQRLLDLEQVEIGGDALKVWEFARNLVQGGNFPKHLNHHTSRFGLVLPSMAAQWVFGSGAPAYYVGPLLATVFLHLFVYLICRKLSGPIGGAVGVLGLLAFDPMVRSSSQILPETFGPMYGAFSTYAALIFSDAKSLAGRWAALCAVGVGLIFAYGAKMVYLFYAPGIAFMVWFGGTQGPLLPPKWSTLAPAADAPVWLRAFHWIKGSRLLIPMVLTVLVLLMVLVETVLLSGLAGSGSRFDVVQSSHGGGGKWGPRIHGAEDFFALYTKAPFEWIQGLTAGALAWLGVMAFARDRRSKLVGVTLLVFFLLQTFIVRRLDPLTPWFQPHPRYLLGMVGPIFMMIGIFSGDAVAKLAQLPDQIVGKSRAISLLGALALFWSVGDELPERYKAEWGKRDAITRTRSLADELSDAYRAGIPIVGDSPEGKPAFAAAALLIDPDLLKDEEGMPIPSSKVLKGMKSRNGRFVARALLSEDINNQRLRNVVEERTRQRRCAVVLRQSVRFITGSTRFDPKCESLEAEFARDPKAGQDGSKTRPGRRNRPGRSSRGPGGE